MAFELEVTCEVLPSDLAARWPRAFDAHGFRVEIMPGFDPHQWQGGFLPFRVLEAPAELVGLELPDPALSGFEVWFEDGAARFRSASGRPTTEFAMQCLGAALLARITGGRYRDPQAGQTWQGEAAIEAALAEIQAFVASARANERVHHSFPGWAALGVEV